MLICVLYVLNIYYFVHIKGHCYFQWKYRSCVSLYTYVSWHIHCSSLSYGQYIQLIIEVFICIFKEYLISKIVS